MFGCYNHLQFQGASEAPPTNPTDHAPSEAKPPEPPVLIESPTEQQQPSPESEIPKPKVWTFTVLKPITTSLYSF